MARNNHSGSSGTSNNAGNTGSNVVNQDPSQNPSSDYYVHPSDGPSFVIVTPPLSGSIYCTLARSMRRALIAKNKYIFIDRSIEVSYKETLVINLVGDVTHNWCTLG